MDTQSSQSWLIERYSPSNTSSRLLIAMPAGFFGVYTLTWTVATFMTAGLWLPLALPLGILSLGAIILSVMMLWPICLSLIGHTDSVEADPRAETRSSAEENRDDPLVIAKRQYAAGNISETEFEQRVENLLDLDSRLHSESTGMNHHNGEYVRDTN